MVTALGSCVKWPYHLGGCTTFNSRVGLLALLNRNLSANKVHWNNNNNNNKPPNYWTSRLPIPVVSELHVAACWPIYSFNGGHWTKGSSLILGYPDNLEVTDALTLELLGSMRPLTWAPWHLKLLCWSSALTLELLGSMGPLTCMDPMTLKTFVLEFCAHTRAIRKHGTFDMHGPHDIKNFCVGVPRSKPEPTWRNSG